MPTTVALTGSGNWVVPAGVTSVRAQLWAGNASGGGTGATIGWNGGGGGSGEYAEEAAYATSPGASVPFAVGAGGTAATNAVGHDGANSTFGTITAHGGKGGKTSTGNAAGGLGGTGSTATIHHDGGTGGAGTAGVNGGGAAGGAGTGAAGNSGSGITGGGSVTGGAAGPNGSSAGNGTAGTAPNGTTTGGSAGSGAYSNTAAVRASGAGAAGQILLTYTATAAANPYLMANPAPAASTTATTVPVTTGSGSGDAILIAACTPLAAASAPSGVTDSHGNPYLLAQAVLSNLGTWVAAGPVPLATSDTATVNWSTTGSNVKDVMVIGVPGAAATSAVDPASASASGTGTAVSVTSGTIANAGSVAILVISNSSTGGTPSALGSFTSLGTVQLSTFQYLTVAYQVLSGTTPVTGSATITSTAWSADLVILSPSSIAAGAAAVVGATIEAGSYGGTLTQDIGTWQNSVINPGRTLDSIRVFFGPGNIPSSMAAAGLTQHAGVRRVLMSFKPGLVGSGNEAANKAALNTLLADCKAGGLDAKVALYHEPDSAAGLTAAQYKACIQYYSATIRTYYPLVYCKAAYKTHTNPTSPGDFYPGDAYVDECAYDFYSTDWRLYGVTLDSMANIADGANPPKAFSCWELGVTVGAISGTTTPPPDTQAQGTAYMSYVTTYFKNRAAAGKPIGDLSYYDYVNVGQNWDFVIQPGSYMAVLYDALYDAMQSGSSGTPPPAQLSSQIDIIVNLTTSLVLGPAPGGGGGGGGGVPPPLPAAGSATYPQLIVEAGLLPAAPVAVLGSFILDDPVQGRLDAGRLGAATAWTDITGLVRSGTISRPSTRVQGPLLSYQAGTCSLILDNADGRFDPDNISGPYAVGGQSLVQPMVPVRISAVFGAGAYSLFSGFADSWQDDGINYAGRYAQVTMTATDGFKILAGQNLPAVANPQGDSELSGARVNRILTAAGWYTDHRKVSAGDSQLQGTTLGDSPLNLLQLTADSEIGELYIDGTGSLVFRNRHAILAETRSVTPQAVFGDAAGTVHPAGTELPYLSAGRADDDTVLANDVQITRVGGVMQRSQSGVATNPPSYLFPRTYSRSDVLLTSDAEALSYAQWVRFVSQATVNRTESVALLPRRAPADLFPQALGREIGDRIQVWRRPAAISPVVTLYGASPSFTPLVAGMTATASGHTFRPQVIGGWGLGAGTGLFYTLALPDGKLALSTVPLTQNEQQPTSDHAEVAVFDPAARSFTRIVIPTSTGATTALTPGDSVGGTDAGGGDIVLAGAKALFTCGGYYFGWSIPSTGLYPAFGFLSSSGGTWSYDAADSLTGDQWKATNSTVFTTTINAAQTAGNGANYWNLREAGQMAVLPVSGNIVVGHYFNGNGFNSGAISVIDTAGNLKCAYQIPSMNRQDGATSILVFPREIKTDPSSSANDERFFVIHDVFGNGNTKPPVCHVIQEFSYNAGTQVIAPKSVPCIPGDDDTQAVFCEVGSDGTLYVSCIGVTGALFARNMAVYLKKAGERNLVTAAPATTTWATDGRYGTPVAADYSLGFAQSQLLWLGGPMAVDRANTGTVLVPAANGYLGVTIPDPVITAPGPNLLPAGEEGMETANVLVGDDEVFANTTGTWTAVSGSTLTQGTPPHAPPPNAINAAKATSTGTAVQVLESGFYPAVPLATYTPQASFLADSVGGVNCIVWLNWYDSGHALISSSATTTISNNTATWTTTSSAFTVIAPAGTAFLKAEVQISTGAAGRIQWFTDVLVWNLTSAWTGFVTNVARSAVLARTGSLSLGLAAPFTQNTVVGHSPSFTCQPGREYRTSGWVRTGSGVPTGTASAAFNWFDASGTQIGSTSPSTVTATTSTSVWTQVSGTCPAPAGAVTGYAVYTIVTGSNMTGTQTQYLDDVTIQQLPFRTLPPAELGVAALRTGGLTVGNGRPSIVGRILYVPLSRFFTAAEQAAYAQATYVPDTAHPSYLAAVDLTQFLSGTAAAGAVVKDCFIRGIEHAFEASSRSWQTTWTLQDANKYAGFLILNSVVQGVLDTNALAY